MSKPKRIFIVGHMGAGKSLLGKVLADKLGWKHIDANIGMERYIGRPLKEIIGKEGLEAFQKCQNEIINHYLNKENIVITTEDSFVDNEKNRKLLEPEYVIYLKVTTLQQMERMSDGPAIVLPVDLKAFLDKLHQERDSLYESVCTQTVNSQSLEGDLDAILKAMA